MYLSYTGFKVADCLFRYWNTYINMTVQQEDDRAGSLYGSIVGKLFEAFYQEKLWRHKNVREVLEARIPQYTDDIITSATTASDWKPAGVVKWRDLETNPTGLYANREELIEDVRCAIPRGLQTIKMHRFLGKDAVAELYLNTEIGGHKFGGRADFVMSLVDSGELVILDGKGSRSRDRWVVPTQLCWYALLYLEKFGKLPDWTAFIFWKKEPPYNVDKHVFTRDDTESLKKEVLELMTKIELLQKRLGGVSLLPVVKDSFRATANDSNCRFCPYAVSGVCDDGAAVVQKLKDRYENR